MKIGCDFGLVEREQNCVFDYKKMEDLIDWELFYVIGFETS